MNKSEEKHLLFIIRLLVVFYIISLVFWGVTAFPIETELNVICGMLGIDEGASLENLSGIKFWLASVKEAIVATNQKYPFLAYGTDWLAFSHIVIAVAFIGVYFKPLTNIWIVYFGMIACVGVIPLALICGAIRDIPLYWRLIDCSFGVFGIIPLYVLLMYIKRLEALVNYPKTEY